MFRNPGNSFARIHGHNEKYKRKAWCCEVGKGMVNVCTKLQTVLRINFGFLTLTSVCQVINGDYVHCLEDIAPEKILKLKYAPLISCDVERSFSSYKHILSDKRQSVTQENIKSIVIG
jgi:hypothetical protein